ncbi:MAG: hypothetical protein K2G35_10370 [Duncaniella sp.]|nr:hypothetical protein [Duncaniella sp.]
MHRTLIASCVALTATVFAADASTPDSMRKQAQDELKDSHQIVYFGNGSSTLTSDSIRARIDRFYEDQFRQFQDPAAPYFLFMSRSSDLTMGIGGLVRMRGYYDWGGAVPASGFSPYFIPVTPDPLNDKALGTTPAGTAFFMRVLGHNARLGDFQGYIEANFNGYQGRDFHLKKAYVIVGDWTVGYASSTFGDGSAVPPTVDAAGPTMKMDATNVLVRYMHTFKKTGITLAASLETPSMSLQTDGTHTAARTQYLPNVAAFVQYAWASDQHVRLSAITRFLPYRDMINGENHMPVGYGFQLSTVASPIPALTLYATVNAGKSYSNFGGDFLLGKYDLVSDTENPGRLNTTPGFGYFVGASYHFSTRLFATATFGQGRYLPTDDPAGTDYKYGLYTAVNLFYNITPRFQVGGEFNIGKRQDFDRQHGWARRIGAMAQFSF